MEKLKIGQLGVGYWGPNLVRNLVQVDEVGKLLVCDRNQERLDHVKRIYNGKIHTTAEERDLFEDDDVHAIVIALPAKDHFLYVKKALEAGKHVLVEKPLAMTIREADELLALAKKRQKVLMAGHTFLFNGAVRRIKQYIDEGLLGDIYYIFSQRLNLGRVREDVDVLWNLAPHDISILLYWLQERPTRVEAKGLTFLQPGIADVAFLNLDFPSNRSAHVHVSWLDPSKTRKIVIVGSKKMLVYDDAATDEKIILYDKGIDKKNILRELPEITNFGQFQLMQRIGDITIPKIEFDEPLKEECRHFVACTLNREEPFMDAAHGREVVWVLEEAQKSMQQSRGEER